MLFALKISIGLLLAGFCGAQHGSDLVHGTDHPDGTFEVFDYDAENRKIFSRDQAERITTFANDPLGRLTAATFPDGATTNAVYDAIGRALGSHLTIRFC